MITTQLAEPWTTARIEEVTQSNIAKGTPTGTEPFTYVDIGSVDNKAKRIVDPKLLLPDEAPTRARQHLLSGDVVVSMTRPNLNAVALVSKELDGAICSTGFHVLRARDSVLPKWLFYFVQTKGFIDTLSANDQGVVYPAVRPKDIQRIRIPIAPLDEQRRIVEVIETQLTRLDAAVAALKRARANLKRYRASVLKAAVEGRLVPTEAELARQEGRGFESGEQLLESANISTMEFSGVLPEGWAATTLGQIAFLKGGLTKGQKRKEHDQLRSVPYLRVANVQRGYLDLNEIKNIGATEQEIADLRLESGDILFNEGGDRDKLGRGWIWSDELDECIYQNHVFRARLHFDNFEPKFFSWFGNTEGQHYFVEQGRQTTNLASLNLTKLAALPVPIPPAYEQTRIARAVEDHLEQIDLQNRILSQAHGRASRLRQSILGSAFSGRLSDSDV